MWLQRLWKIIDAVRGFVAMHDGRERIDGNRFGIKRLTAGLPPEMLDSRLLPSKRRGFNSDFKLMAGDEVTEDGVDLKQGLNLGVYRALGIELGCGVGRKKALDSGQMGKKV
jgi:hypothetical protein